MSRLLNVEHLKIGLKKTGEELVHDISFSVGEGESLVILGQSGSGKTMTCRALMGLLDRKRFFVEGSLSFEGRQLINLGQKDRGKIYGGAIAMIPQNPMSSLDPSMRIGRQMEETLALHSGLRGRALDERIDRALAEAGLSDTALLRRSYPHMLSGGMLQRVTIAMALMVDARCIVADEPTTALDVTHRDGTIDAFIRFRERGAGVVLVTHDFEVAARMGGQILVMKTGRMVETGKTEELLKCPRAEYTRALLAASRLSGAAKGRKIQC